MFISAGIVFTTCADGYNYGKKHIIEGSKHQL